MNTTKKLLGAAGIAGLILVMCCCAGNKQFGSNPLFERITDQHENVIYTGSLPCEDCKALSTLLKLNRDKSYTLEFIPEGKSDEVFRSEGTYGWKRKVIILTPGDSLTIPLKYFAEDNRLLSATDKTNFLVRSENLLLERYWKLVELKGVPINAPESSEREAHLIFKTLNNRIFGSSGCNRFSGRYDMNDNRIRISQVISTKMACMNVPYENDFFTVLAAIDRISAGNDTLLFMKDNATMARFISVNGKE